VPLTHGFNKLLSAARHASVNQQDPELRHSNINASTSAPSNSHSNAVQYNTIRENTESLECVQKLTRGRIIAEPVYNGIMISIISKPTWKITIWVRRHGQWYVLWVTHWAVPDTTHLRARQCQTLHTWEPGSARHYTPESQATANNRLLANSNQTTALLLCQTTETMFITTFVRV